MFPLGWAIWSDKCFKCYTHYPSTLSCSLCLRLEKNKYTFGSVGVFHQQGPCTWSLPCLYEQVHFEQHMKEFFNSQTPPSEGPGSTSTNTLSKMLPTPHFELLGKRRTWVNQEVQTSRSAPESNDAPEEWTRWEVLSRRLKTLDPCRKMSTSSTQVTFLDQEGRPWCSKHRVHNQWIFFSEDTLRHRI